MVSATGEVRDFNFNLKKMRKGSGRDPDEGFSKNGKCKGHGVACSRDSVAAMWLVPSGQGEKCKVMRL